MAALLGPVLDLILFKLSWLVLVVGQHRLLWPAVVIVGSALILNQAWRKQWLICLLIALFGMTMDQLLTVFDVFRFPTRTIPLWLILLWASFATALPSAFGFLRKFPLHWQVVAGAIAGPLAYGAARQLNAVSFGLPLWQVLGLLAGLWGVFIPFCLAFLRRPPASLIGSVLSGLLLLLMIPGSRPVLAEPSYPLLGTASFRVLWWHLYDASLYALTPEFVFPQTRPFIFSLEYRRDIGRELLVRETLKQWDEQQVQVEPEWITTLTALMPDVRKGDVLSMEVASDFQTLLRHNNTVLGEVTDPALVTAFAGIWLATNTTHPDFRQQLLGTHP